MTSSLNLSASQIKRNGDETRWGSSQQFNCSRTILRIIRFTSSVSTHQTKRTSVAVPRTVNTYVALEKSGPVQPWQYESRVLGSEDVETKISHCGICGSDIHTLDSGWGPAVCPCVPAHEIIGEVIVVGEDVKHLAVGNRVRVGAQV
ncbi:Mannitol dehydrogenase, partial [Globisporangium splendens]